MTVLLVPPFAFVAYLLLAGALLGIGKVLAGGRRPSASEKMLYASGERSSSCWGWSRCCRRSSLACASIRRLASGGGSFTRVRGPARLRGPVQWDRLNCTGCGVCVLDCPANALQLVTLDKASKRFVLDYHLERCTFCSQCVESCKHAALWMSNVGWELATPDLAGLVMHYGEPEDVLRVLADRIAAGADSGHSA